MEPAGAASQGKGRSRLELRVGRRTGEEVPAGESAGAAQGGGRRKMVMGEACGKEGAHV